MYMKFEVAAMIRNILDGGLTVCLLSGTDTTTHTHRQTDRQTDTHTKFLVNASFVFRKV